MKEKWTFPQPAEIPQLVESFDKLEELLWFEPYEGLWFWHDKTPIWMRRRESEVMDALLVRVAGPPL